MRLVDALTGDAAPSKFFAALTEADRTATDLDRVRELETRVAELEAPLEDCVCARRRDDVDIPRASICTDGLHNAD